MVGSTVDGVLLESHQAGWSLAVRVLAGGEGTPVHKLAKFQLFFLNVFLFVEL